MHACPACAPENEKKENEKREKEREALKKREPVEKEVKNASKTAAEAKKAKDQQPKMWLMSSLNAQKWAGIGQLEPAAKLVKTFKVLTESAADLGAFASRSCSHHARPPVDLSVPVFGAQAKLGET